MSSLDARVVGVPAVRISAVRESSSARPAGYIPDGLTEQEYESMKKKNADSAAKKKKFYKEKKYEVWSLGGV